MAVLFRGRGIRVAVLFRGTGIRVAVLFHGTGIRVAVLCSGTGTRVAVQMAACTELRVVVRLAVQGHGHSSGCPFKLIQFVLAASV